MRQKVDMGRIITLPSNCNEKLSRDTLEAYLDKVPEYSVGASIQSQEIIQLAWAQFTVQYNRSGSVHITMLHTPSVVVVIQDLELSVIIQRPERLVHCLWLTDHLITNQSPRWASGSLWLLWCSLSKINGRSLIGTYFLVILWIFTLFNCKLKPQPVS